MNARLGTSRVSVGRYVQDALWVAYAQIVRAMVQQTSGDFVCTTLTGQEEEAITRRHRQLTRHVPESVTFNNSLREVSPPAVSRTIRCKRFP